MSRKVHIFIADASLNENTYSEYLSQCRSLSPAAAFRENYPLDLDQRWECHFCDFTADLNTAQESYDIERFFATNVSLYRNIHGEEYWMETRRYPWRLQLEATYCLRGLVLQFLMAMKAYQVFPEMMLGDDNAEVSDLDQLSSSEAECLAHAIKVLDVTYGHQRLVSEGHLDLNNRLKI